MGFMQHLTKYLPNLQNYKLLKKQNVQIWGDGSHAFLNLAELEKWFQSVERAESIPEHDLLRYQKRCNPNFGKLRNPPCTPAEAREKNNFERLLAGYFIRPQPSRCVCSTRVAGYMMC